jgi:hypothetical protein
MKTFGKREKEWFSVPATNGQRKELTVSFQKNFSSITNDEKLFYNDGMDKIDKF